MKKTILALFVYSFVVSLAMAQLGVFPGKIMKEYGAPSEEGRVHGRLWQTFKKNGLYYKIFYKNNESYKVEVYKTVAKGGVVNYTQVPSADISNVLKQFSNGKTWFESVQTDKNVKKWKRDDSGAYAEYNAISKILTIKQGKIKSRRSASKAADSRRDETPQDWTPFQFSLIPNVMLPNKKAVHGMKIGFPVGSQYSDVKGVDFSFVSLTANMEGFGGALVNVRKTFDGVTGAVVNLVHDECSGAQLGVVNIAGESNDNCKVDGAQFGVVNYARDMNGFQFGLINYISQGPIKFLPFINFKFDKHENE